MKIIIFGGDGFCGWPLTLRLSKNSNKIMIVDNFLRRKIDQELGVKPIYPIYSLNQRIKTWKKITGKEILFKKIDLSKEINKIEKLFYEFKPDAVVVLAELKSAPYSVKSLSHSNRTITNNLLVNNNILHTIAKYNKNIHFVHIGTMGVYGYDYSKILIPDGYYKADLYNHLNQKITKKILHPSSPGSIYHLSKAQDELLFQYYNKLYNLKITDLHQGVVWGINTLETDMNEKLSNRFDYDGEYGTVLNRFIAQASIGYPLTVHGSGKQIRPIININNTVDCIEIALKYKYKSKRVRVLNQLAETIRVVDIAKKISNLSGVKIDYQKNPRIENENNKLKAKPIGLIELGLKPIYLDNNYLKKEIEKTKKHGNSIIRDKIKSKILWKKSKQ